MLTRIKQGSGELHQLGALDDRRDWSYAGDFVDAIILAMQRKADRLSSLVRRSE